jgi:hypothetical protein
MFHKSLHPHSKTIEQIGPHNFPNLNSNISQNIPFNFIGQPFGCWQRFSGNSGDCGAFESISTDGTGILRDGWAGEMLGKNRGMAFGWRTFFRK